MESSSILRTIKTSYRLRQYGQKDPLSEFKKAFVLFEGLLTKIKYDVIRLLLNLNIVVSSKDENKDEKLFRIKLMITKKLEEMKNAHAVRKKFKHCHGSI